MQIKGRRECFKNYVLILCLARSPRPRVRVFSNRNFRIGGYSTEIAVNGWSPLRSNATVIINAWKITVSNGGKYGGDWQVAKYPALRLLPRRSLASFVWSRVLVTALLTSSHLGLLHAVSVDLILEWTLSL